MKSPVVYSFENGVQYVDSVYNGAPEPQHSGHSIPFAEIDQIQQQAVPGNQRFDGLMEELDDVRVARYGHANRFGFEQSGTIEYALFNQNGSSETINLILLGWRSDFKLTGTKRGVGALALAQPNQRFAVCNFMGRGESSPLSLSTSAAMAATGSFQPAGERLLSALDQSGILKDANGVDTLGESEGDRLLLGTVAAGLQVRNCVAVDGVGTKHLGLPGLAYKLRKVEARHGKAYADHSTDAWSQELYETHNNPDAMRADTASAANNWRDSLGPYLLHPWALAQNGRKRDLEVALPNIKEELTNLFFERSAIGCHTAVRRHLHAIAAAAEIQRPDTLRMRVGLGLTHAMSLGGPGARALLYTRQGGPGVTE